MRWRRNCYAIVPAEQGRQRVKLRHLNFDPYPSRTHTGPCVTLIHFVARLVMEQCACLNSETMEIIGHFKKKVGSGEQVLLNGTATLLYYIVAREVAL